MYNGFTKQDIHKLSYNKLFNRLLRVHNHSSLYKRNKENISHSIATNRFKLGHFVCGLFKNIFVTKIKPWLYGLTAFTKTGSGKKRNTDTLQRALPPACKVIRYGSRDVLPFPIPVRLVYLWLNEAKS